MPFAEASQIGQAGGEVRSRSATASPRLVVVAGSEGARLPTLFVHIEGVASCMGVGFR
jgi:hypothetical protein